MSNKIKIASDLFRQKWFRELEPKYKSLWLYLTLESNSIGVFEVDADAWCYHCRASGITDADAFKRFGNRIVRVPNHPSKGIVVDKLFFQSSFGRNSAQWKWVERELAAVGMTYDQLAELSGKPFTGDAETGIDEAEASSADNVPTTFVPPTYADLTAYCADEDLNIDAARFMSYYSSRGWKVGNRMMVDWRAAARFWAKNAKTGVRKVADQPKRKLF